MRVRSSLLAVSVVAVPILLADDKDTKNEEARAKFVVTAVERLQLPKGPVLKPTSLDQWASVIDKSGWKPDTEKDKALTDALKKFAKNPRDEKAFADLAFQLSARARETKTTSKVKVTTKKAGATVRYELDQDRKDKQTPQTAKALTDCEEVMVIGYYYVWAERDGKAVSDKDKEYLIVNKDEAIELVEK